MQERNSYYKKYQIIEQLITGPHYQIFLVLDTEQNRRKLQKVIILTKENQLKIIEQIKKLKQIDHPNISKIYDYYIDTPTNLKTREPITKLHIILPINKKKFQPNQLLMIQQPNAIIDIYLQLKNCLYYLDTKNVLHRNIHIDRIALEYNKIKIFQFGMDRNSILNTRTDKESEESFDDFYKSPQQIHQRKANKKSFYWRLGILLVQMLIKKHIYDVYPKFPALKISQFIDFLKGLKLNKNVEKLILPLLEEDYKIRSFLNQIDYNQSDKHLNLSERQPNDIQIQHIIKYNNFQRLISLNCSNCKLTDQSGKTIRNLFFLEYLNVSGNDLFDQFTQFIHQQLEKLIICNFAFTNISDASLMLLTNVQRQLSLIRDFKLQQLDISYTRVTSKGIMKLSKLRHLVSLSVWSGQFFPYRYKTHIVENISLNYAKYNYHKIFITQQCIKELCKLKLLSISMDCPTVSNILNKINQEVYCVQVEGKLNQLTIAQINRSKIIESLYLKDLEVQLSSLKSNKFINLSLINCKLRCEGSNICLQKCQSLNLSYNNIKDTDITWILANAKQIKFLNLSNNNIGDISTKKISKLRLLEQLDLSYNKVTKQGAKQISNLLCLKILNLNENNIGDEGTLFIAENLDKLAVLNLMNNNLTLEGALSIGQHLINIKSLNLSYNKIGNDGILFIASQLYGIHSIEAWENNIDPVVKDQVRQILKNAKIWF